MKGEHFLDTNIMIAWLVHVDHHNGRAKPYFARAAGRHTSDFVMYEVRQVLGRVRKAAGDLAVNLDASQQSTIGTQNALLKAVRQTKVGLDKRDQSRVERLARTFHADIQQFQSGTITAADLLDRMTKPFITGLNLLRTQTMCLVHRVPRDVRSRYGVQDSALSKIIRNHADVKVILGANHVATTGVALVPFITVDGTDILANAAAIQKIVPPLSPIAPDAWASLP